MRFLVLVVGLLRMLLIVVVVVVGDAAADDDDVIELGVVEQRIVARNLNSACNLSPPFLLFWSLLLLLLLIGLVRSPRACSWSVARFLLLWFPSSFLVAEINDALKSTIFS